MNRSWIYQGLSDLIQSKVFTKLAKLIQKEWKIILNFQLAEEKTATERGVFQPRVMRVNITSYTKRILGYEIKFTAANSGREQLSRQWRLKWCLFETEEPFSWTKIINPPQARGDSRQRKQQKPPSAQLETNNIWVAVPNKQKWANLNRKPWLWI